MKEISKNRLAFFVVSITALIGLIVTFLMINNNIITKSSIYYVKKDTSTTDIKAEFVKRDLIFANDKKSNLAITIPKDTIFNSNPIFLLWFGLILSMVTVASGAAGIYTLQIVNFKRTYQKLTLTDIIIAFSLAIIIILVIAWIQWEIKGTFDIIDIFKNFGILFQNAKVPVWISGITLGLTIPIIVTIFLISIIAQNMEGVSDNELKIHASLNKSLMDSLQILAIIIAFSVFTTSALGHAIKNQVFIDPKVIDTKYFDIFPKQFSYIYGLLFSIFLAIVFFPVYIQLQNKGRELVEMHEKNPEKRELLIEKLKTDSSLKETLKLIMTVLLPFLTSIASELKP